MSYSEVRRIIGAPGEEVSRSDLAGLTTVMYSWINSNGSNMNAMFQNDELIQKAQFGLRELNASRVVLDDVRYVDDYPRRQSRACGSDPERCDSVSAADQRIVFTLLEIPLSVTTWIETRRETPQDRTKTRGVSVQSVLRYPAPQRRKMLQLFVAHRSTLVGVLLTSYGPPS